MIKSRKLKLITNYKPFPSYEGDEIYPNGIFHFNITGIMEHITTGKIEVEKEQIDVKQWFWTHMRKSVNEQHLPSVDVTKPVLQAEIRPGKFEIIDGNHRLEKAFHDNIVAVDSYKLKGEQLIPFFIDKRGYEAFVDYWNSKI